MFRYLIRRVLWALLLFVVITFVTFVIFFMGPQDPARAQCGGDQASRSCLVLVTEKLGLDKPMYVQYWKFLRSLVWNHSLGHSYAQGQDLNGTIIDASRQTASLVFGGAILWMLIGLTVGVYSALRPRSLLDRTAMIFVLIGVSAHPIWLGLIFEYFFGVKWHITPIANYANFFGALPGSGEPGGPWQWFYHLILPWCVFATLFAALYVRMIRANVLEAMNEDYVRTARAKGASEAIVMRSHVLRNAMLPVVTMLGMDIGLAMGGAIFTESVFGLPGIGRTAVQALEGFDLPTVQGIVVFATVAIIVFNLAVDLLYAVIDPRIRLS
jgi:peptide/nickel transport system permease protein